MYSAELCQKVSSEIFRLRCSSRAGQIRSVIPEAQVVVSSRRLVEVCEWLKTDSAMAFDLPLQN